ncbi:MAG TPA: NAD(P)H-hydrate dehydratase [Thermoanaerobaculia bacterium]|nr:NAD(P)H-hydrate dehydratase [Thermoanaerobaculia bacterium]
MVLMHIVTSDQMRRIDRRATDEYGIPSLLLMEHAAMAITETIRSRYPDAEAAAIFCGTGKNGGDGLAVARLLHNRGVTPIVLIIGERERFSGDSAINLEICRRLGLPMFDVTGGELLDTALARASETDVIVDALFGTGLNRPAEGIFGDTIRGMLSLRLPIVSVDLPSGLDASSHELLDPAIRAEVTVTFALPKVAHVFEPASSWSGEIVVADISIPRPAVDAEGVTLSLLTEDEIAELMPEREASSHKGTHGHLGILSGSAGRSGAAILACRGAVRGGAGLVTLLSDPETARLVDAVSIESMSRAIEPGSGLVDQVLSAFEGFSAGVIGPGLPDDEETYASIRELVGKLTLPLVLDATAINAFEGTPALINPDEHPRVITPHPGELSRLMGGTTAEINRNRVEAARAAAAASRCVVVLKGHQTLIADPAGHVSVNPTGNAGMASGGMGDVLSGLMGAWLARGEDPFDAACAAVYLHGLAGDLLRERSSDVGLAAMDLADSLPEAVSRVRKA